MAVLLGAWLCIVTTVRAAEPLSTTPQHIKSILTSGTDAQRTAIASQLGLVIPKSARLGATADIPCVSFDSVELHRARLLPTGSQSLIEAVSSRCAYAYVVILGKAGESRWNHLGTLRLLAVNRLPRITLESLIEPGVQEIVARDNEADYGTGMLQLNMTIWKLFSCGPQVIFDEPSSETFDVPAGRGAHLYNTMQEERSEFSFIEPESGAGGAKQILQKQTIRSRAVSITRWWIYNWSSAMKRFRKVPTLR